MSSWSALLVTVSMPLPFEMELMSKELFVDLVRYCMDKYLWIDNHIILLQTAINIKRIWFPLVLLYFFVVCFIGTIYEKLNYIGMNEWFGVHLYKHSIWEILLQCVFGWIFMIFVILYEYFKGNLGDDICGFLYII